MYTLSAYKATASAKTFFTHLKKTMDYHQSKESKVVKSKSIQCFFSRVHHTNQSDKWKSYYVKVNVTGFMGMLYLAWPHDDCILSNITKAMVVYSNGKRKDVINIP